MTTNSSTALVVWWRLPPTVEVPRLHRIGWATPDAARTGILTLPSPHPHLPADEVAAHLAAELSDQLGRSVQPEPLSDRHQTSAVVRLHAAGHHVVDADLLTNYGLDVIAGITAELRGRGVDATVLLEQTLQGPVRDAAAAWAEATIDTFTHANPDALRHEGWHQLTNSRWQILARQS